MTYDEALRLLDGLESRGWRLGLDRMRAFVDRAGLRSTLDGRGYMHVAGTNGKGTTTAFTESILRHQGWRTGAFYSPFVIDYRERIQANGKMIERNEVAGLVARLLPVAEAMAETEFGGATKFELEAAMGLAYWEDQGCDWVAVEVGLGGRLDATNVIVPRACVIVSIGLDHTGILGNTLGEIAAEKAGIIKPGIPVIVGQMLPEAEETIVKIATERSAPIWRMGREIEVRGTDREMEVITPVGSFHSPVPALGADFPPHNAALAVAACAAAGAIRNADSIGAGLVEAWIPGRSDWREVKGRKVLFDGAHNADAARHLVRKIGDRPLRLVTNMVSGHEVAGFYREFAQCAVGAEVGPIDSPRALAVDDAVGQIRAAGIPAQGHATVAAALSAALEHNDAQVVVTGSNYLVGEALRLIG